MNLKEYVYEYDFLECALNENMSIEKYITAAYVEYVTECRSATHRAYFETGTDILAMEAEAKEGFLAKLGKQVEKLVESIRRFLSSILDKINPRKKVAEEQENKLKDIIRKNPNFGKAALAGLVSGKLSVKDYDQLVKTADSIMKMYEADQITEDQFNDKIGQAIDKFNKSGKTITTTISTATGLVAAISGITVALDNMGKTQNYFKSLTERFNTRYEKLSTQSPSKAKNIFRALVGIDKLSKEEYSLRYAILNKVTTIAIKLTGSNSVTGVLTDKANQIKAKDDSSVATAKEKFMSDKYKDDDGNPITKREADKKEADKRKTLAKATEEEEVKAAAKEAAKAAKEAANAKKDDK